MPTDAAPDRDPAPAAGDEFSRDLILPGGKVDPEAIRRVAEADEETSEEERLVHVTFELSRDLDKRLDKYLTDRITFMSRNQLQKLIDVGGVKVNGRQPKAATKLRLGDKVEVDVPPPPPTEIQPENIPLEVLYEDDHIIVINKQSDLIVHPARSHLKGTLLNALVYHFQNAAGANPTVAAAPNSDSSPHPASRKPQAALSSVGKEFARPGVIHRLDRHTSGVMVVGKSDEAHWLLARQFEHRTVDKRYLALVQGVIESDADVIDQPIGPHPSRAKGLREKMVVRHDEFGKNAVTIYRVRERYPAPPPHADVSMFPPGALKQGFTLVELELKTGRTHQIRVHLSHLGYPIAGDDMYGGRVIDGWMTRQALHATLLGFKHPTTHQPMVFTAPVPGDITRLVGQLRQMKPAGVPDRAVPGATVDLERAITSPSR